MRNTSSSQREILAYSTKSFIWTLYCGLFKSAAAGTSLLYTSCENDVAMESARRINVAIASPNDVTKERDAVSKVFMRWNDANQDVILHPVMWESASVPTMGEHPQRILNKQIIDRSELLVAIFWSKLGTPTPTAASGTVEEIREFIEKKGPGRVMLYFSKHNLPHDIDPIELKRLKDFKSQMQSQGLFSEYATVDQFETDLYRHLDQKIQQLLTGQLPLPSKLTPSEVKGPQHADPRLRETIDFGTTLTEIAKGFKARMGEFEQISGGGPNKFLDLAAHVYSSCAECLDRYMTFSAQTLTHQGRTQIEKVSSRLKRLAASSKEYLKKPFGQYWIDGREISKDLIAEVEHLSRVGRV